MSELVNPQCPIPFSASSIHGITDEMVKRSPLFGGVAPKFLSMIENTVVVGHNVCFDVKFLNMELGRVGLKFPDLPLIDTLTLARRSAAFKSNALGALASELNISCENWHRALNDVMTTREVFYFFVRGFAAQGICSFKDIHQRSGGKYVRQVV